MKEGIIGPISPNLQVPEIRRPRELVKEQGGASFGETLRDAITTVNNAQKESDMAVQKLMTGESQDLHATLIAVQKADLSFQMMMQVRNKIIQAYQEIMRTQI
jgi:flagellar hook-basal body complex protein FliE